MAIVVSSQKLLLLGAIGPVGLRITDWGPRMRMVPAFFIIASSEDYPSHKCLFELWFRHLDGLGISGSLGYNSWRKLSIPQYLLHGRHSCGSSRFPFPSCEFPPTVAATLCWQNQLNFHQLWGLPAKHEQAIDLGWWTHPSGSKLSPFDTNTCPFWFRSWTRTSFHTTSHDCSGSLGKGKCDMPYWQQSLWSNRKSGWRPGRCEGGAQADQTGAIEKSTTPQLRPFHFRIWHQFIKSRVDTW